MVKYTYSIMNDFPNQAVLPSLLHEEILESSIASGFKFVTIDGDACKLNFDGDLSSAEETVLDGIVAAHDAIEPPSLFGPGYGKSDNQSSTTSTSYQQKLRLTTDDLISGTYRIGWYYEYRLSSISYDFRARVQINDTDTIMEQREEIKDSGSDQWRGYSGFDYFTIEGVTNIDLDYCSSNSRYAAYIRRARLEIREVE